MKLRFLLVCEGSSDAALVGHLRKLCVACGCREVSGTTIDLSLLPRPPGRRVIDKVRAAVELEPGADIVVVHRDADRRDPEPRYREILTAAEKLGIPGRCVAVVPVQATEAWLLLDEASIRRVVGRPAGRVPLHLPSPHRVEACADPKTVLRDSLVLASEATGRRRAQVLQRFGAYRRILLERLPVAGPLDQVVSWLRLRDDLERWIAASSSARA